MTPSSPALETLNIQDLGLVEYHQAYQVQMQTVRRVIEGSPSSLLICEHPPVFTLGRIATEENFLLSPAHCRQQGIDIVRTDRGGEVTFHGPGQLVIYPVLNLSLWRKDIRLYMNKLEEVAIDLLRDFGIVAISIPSQRGLWVEDRKIASIGIGVRKWVTFHGMALNASVDLKYFTMIKPCGLDCTMTSLEGELNKSVDLELLKEKWVQLFANVFGVKNIKRETKNGN